MHTTKTKLSKSLHTYHSEDMNMLHIQTLYLRMSYPSEKAFVDERILPYTLDILSYAGLYHLYN